MSDFFNRLSRLWQELRRRNVTRVVTVYAATAFVILDVEAKFQAEHERVRQWLDAHDML